MLASEPVGERMAGPVDPGARGRARAGGRRSRGDAGRARTQRAGRRPGGAARGGLRRLRRACWRRRPTHDVARRPGAAARSCCATCGGCRSGSSPTSTTRARWRCSRRCADRLAPGAATRAGAGHADDAGHVRGRRLHRLRVRAAARPVARRARAARADRRWTATARDPSLRSLIDVVPFGLPAEPPRRGGAGAEGRVAGDRPRRPRAAVGRRDLGLARRRDRIRAVARLADRDPPCTSSSWASSGPALEPPDATRGDAARRSARARARAAGRARALQRRLGALRGARRVAARGRPRRLRPPRPPRGPLRLPHAGARLPVGGPARRGHGGRRARPTSSSARGLGRAVAAGGPRRVRGRVPGAARPTAAEWELQRRRIAELRADADLERRGRAAAPLLRASPQRRRAAPARAVAAADRRAVPADDPRDARSPRSPPSWRARPARLASPSGARRAGSAARVCTP